MDKMEMENIESRIEALLAKYAQETPAPEKNERMLQVGDMVSFTYEGKPWKGVIEYADDESTLYTVRVYAEANGMYEATDVLYDVMSDGDIAIYIDESIKSGDFVSFLTKAGTTIGIVAEIGDDDITVEVVDEYKGELSHTGIDVTHPKASFKKIAPLEVNERQSKILAKFKDFTMDVQTDAEDRKIGIIEGYASVYGNTDLGGDIVKKGAFTQTLSHKNYKTLLLFDHGYKTRDIAGVAYYEDDERGLKLRGEMPLDSPEVASAYNTVKFVVERGIPMGLSIGYNTKKKNMLTDGRRELLELSLEESSITPFPMNTEAQITAAKSKRLIFASKSLLWSQLEDAPIGNPHEEGVDDTLLLEIKQTLNTILKQ
jgi:HK97 family phage prohead protease